MRQLPVSDPGRPDLRSAYHFLMWLIKEQRASVLLGIVWGCAWMVAQALVPAVIGSAIDALASRLDYVDRQWQGISMLLSGNHQGSRHLVAGELLQPGREAKHLLGHEAIER